MNFKERVPTLVRGVILVQELGICARDESNTWLKYVCFQGDDASFESSIDWLKFCPKLRVIL